MRVLGCRLIFGVFFFVGFQLSNLCLADEIQRTSGKGEFVKPAAGTSHPSFGRKSAGEIFLVPIQEFVNQPFPSPLPFQHFRKIRAYAEDPKTVPKLIMLLEENCKTENINKHQRTCSNIVTTLGVLGSPESLSGIRDFLNQEIQKSNPRVMTDAVRAMGLWANVMKENLGDHESGTEINSVLEDLVKRSKEGLEKEPGNVIDQKSTRDTSKGDNREGVSNNSNSISAEKLLAEMSTPAQKSLRRLRRAALQGLAFSGSEQVVPFGNENVKKKVNEHLESLLARAPVGGSFRAFIIELLSVHNIIAKVGVQCYFEQDKEQDRSDECRARWAGEMKFVSGVKTGS